MTCLFNRTVFQRSTFNFSNKQGLFKQTRSFQTNKVSIYYLHTAYISSVYQRCGILALHSDSDSDCNVIFVNLDGLLLCGTSSLASWRTIADLSESSDTADPVTVIELLS